MAALKIAPKDFAAAPRPRPRRRASAR